MQPTVEASTYLLALAEPIFTQLDDSHGALEPMPGAKTAGWLVGHLAVSGDFARRLCGRPPLCPAIWRTAFAPSNAATVCDLKGPFTNGSVGAGAGIAGSIDVFSGNSDHGWVTGGGFTVGAGLGAGGFAGGTWTSLGPVLHV